MALRAFILPVVIAGAAFAQGEAAPAPPAALPPTAAPLPFAAPAPPAAAAARDPHRWFTSSELAAARAYHRPRYLRALADQLVQLAFFAALLAGGLSRRLRDRCARLARGSWLGTTVLYALGYFALALVLDLPEDYWFGYLQPRAHGLSDMTLARWATTTARAACFEALGLAALAVGVFGLMRRLGDRWWLWLGAPAAVAVAFAGALDPARLKLDHSLAPLPDGPQRAAIDAVVRKAGLEVQQISVLDASLDTHGLEAFVAGQGPTRRIVLYDTLVAAATPRELAAIVAHELGHVRDHRALRAGLSAAGVIPFLYVAAIALRRLKRRFGIAGEGDVASLPLLLGVVWLATLAGTPLSNALGRRLETRADAYALELTGDPAALRSALVKLGRINKLDPDPPALAVAFLYSHPPLVDRLAALEGDHH